MKAPFVNQLIAVLALAIAPGTIHAQQRLPQVADSFRRAYHIPELGFAIVKPDSLPAMYLCGYHRIDQTTAADSARLSDYFHLGSNTKAITGFIAGWLVESERIQWTTKFFDLFPEWRAASNKAYHDITLTDLLSHRARIQPFTSGQEYRKLPGFKGNPSEQRKQFAKYLLAQKPVAADGEAFHYSNAGYSIAALMLEKASGHNWEELVQEVLGERLHMRYVLGWPNKMDTPQPWGHWVEDGKLRPVPPDVPYDLRLAEPAGDISMPLADYARLIQLQLQGLQGRDNFLKSRTYQYLHTCRPEYAIGWLNVADADRQLSEHAGSAGTFYCYTLINRKESTAYIVVANCGAAQAEEGVSAFVKQLTNPGESPEPPVRQLAEADRSLLKLYTGTYASAEMKGFELVVREKGGQLSVQATGQEEIAVKPGAANKFFVPNFPISLEFLPNGEKPVTTLMLLQNGKHEFKRKL